MKKVITVSKISLDSYNKLRELGYYIHIAIESDMPDQFTKLVEREHAGPDETI
jgi:hypothetical protein